MNCPEARKLVHLFVDGALDPRANVDVLAHLNMCVPCSEKFAGARKFEEFLSERLAPAPAPGNLRMRIEVSLAEISAPWPVRMAGRLRRRPVALFSGVAALVAVTFVSAHFTGKMMTCPYVRGATGNLEKILTGMIAPIPANADGAIKRRQKEMPPAPAIIGLVHTKDFMVDMELVHRDAIAYAYRMDHCPDDRVCAVLYMVDAPGLVVHEHDTVVKNGKKLMRWQHDNCNIVCWKDEKHGVYCLMVCKRQEMEPDALLNCASIAATQ